MKSSSRTWAKKRPKKKPAYQQKVAPTCEEALKCGIDYVWIDTCCIDKSSSAELQEAINSMFKWYNESSVCFVYLEDVPLNIDESTNLETEDESIIESRWFTRGWTLQELVAPTNLIFYSKYWDDLGTRTSFSKLISKKMKIDEDIFSSKTFWELKWRVCSKSIANRMSWAAYRETTRPEDIAYCLLGIFDVNMPLLYGEGEEKAFCRLQEEILKNSDDQSLLAWTAWPEWSEEVSERDIEPRGALAKYPIEFRYASNIVPLSGVPNDYFLTSSGLRIDLLLVPDKGFPSHPETWGVLRCHYKDDFTGPIAIPLEPQPWKGNRIYRRKRQDIIAIDRLTLTNNDIFQNGPSNRQGIPRNETITILTRPEIGT